MVFDQKVLLAYVEPLWLDWWTEEPGGQLSVGLQRVAYNLEIKQPQQMC